MRSRFAIVAVALISTSATAQSADDRLKETVSLSQKLGFAIAAEDVDQVCEMATIIKGKHDEASDAMLAAGTNVIMSGDGMASEPERLAFIDEFGTAIAVLNAVSNLSGAATMACGLMKKQ